MCDKKKAGWNLLPKAKAQLSIRCSTVSERKTYFSLLCGSKLPLQRFKNTNAKVSERGNGTGEREFRENWAGISEFGCRWLSDGVKMGEMWRGTSKNKKTQQRRGESRRKNKEKRKGAEELIELFAVHRVSLTLPVDPGPVHMSAHLRAYVSTIT